MSPKTSDRDTELTTQLLMQQEEIMPKKQDFQITYQQILEIGWTYYDKYNKRLRVSTRGPIPKAIDKYNWGVSAQTLNSWIIDQKHGLHIGYQESPDGPPITFPSLAKLFDYGGIPLRPDYEYTHTVNLNNLATVLYLTYQENGRLLEHGPIAPFANIFHWPVQWQTIPTWFYDPKRNLSTPWAFPGSNDKPKLFNKINDFFEYCKNFWDNPDFSLDPIAQAQVDQHWENISYNPAPSKEELEQTLISFKPTLTITVPQFLTRLSLLATAARKDTIKNTLQISPDDISTFLEQYNDAAQYLQRNKLEEHFMNAVEGNDTYKHFLEEHSELKSILTRYAQETTEGQSPTPNHYYDFLMRAIP